MRLFCRLFVVALIVGLPTIVKADPLDFRMSVLDGPITGAFITDTRPFQVSFGDCPTTDQNLVGALGCFTGINDTGGRITSIDLTFDNTISPTDTSDDFNYLDGQSPNCVPSAFFDNANSPCFLNGGMLDPTAKYILDFSGGTGIANGTTFYIAEYDASPNAFQGGVGMVTFTADTPEPSSILLLSTGIAMMGLFFFRQRRSATPLRFHR